MRKNKASSEKRSPKVIKKGTQRSKKGKKISKKIPSKKSKAIPKKNLNNINIRLANELFALMQVDIDIVEVYLDVIAGVKDNKDISDQLSLFREDHLRHIDGLSRWITRYGGYPPLRATDANGLLMHMYNQLRERKEGINGTKGYLLALQSSEQITNHFYKNITKIEIPNQELKKTLVNGFEDEKRHLVYIEKQLKLNQGPGSVDHH